MPLSRTGSSTPPLDAAYAFFNTRTEDIYNFSIRKAVSIRNHGISRNDLFLLMRFGKEKLDQCNIFAGRDGAQNYVNIASPEITNVISDWVDFRDAVLASMDWIVTYAGNNPDPSYTLAGGPYVAGSALDNPTTYTDYKYTLTDGLSDFLLTHITSAEIELYAQTLDAITLTIQT